MSKKKESKRSFSTLNRVIIIQLIIMLGLSLFITKTVSSKTRDNAVDHMGAITDERAHIIDSYIEDAEKTLRAFSKAAQIKDLLEYENTMDLQETLTSASPDQKAVQLQQVAQEYTEQFSKEIDNLEGLWVGTWKTFVLTHSNPDVVGITTRSDPDRLKELQNAMVGGDRGLYDAGIIISPASQKQCISMYIAIYDSKGEPVGLAGLGIFTSGLVQTLDNIPVRGIENSFYSMVNVSNNKYIFNKNADNIDIEATNPEILDLCKKFKGTDKAVTGEFEYKDGGKKYVSSYTYMPSHGWIVMIDDLKSEVFALTRTMRIYLGIFGAIIVGVTIVFYFISKKQERINQKLISTIAKNNQTKKSLNAAMFNDVLTNAKNRICFAMEIDKVDISKKNPCYFMMFNIANFSDINVQYGNDAGDTLLVRTVDILKEQFPDSEIYRTGSDEFVVMLSANDGRPGEEEVKDKVNTTLRNLLIPADIGDEIGTVYPKYKVSIARKTDEADTSVVSILKDLTNKTGEATYGMIDYVEL